MRIVVFGDSIAWGAWDTHGGWVLRLDAWAKQAAIAQLPTLDEHIKVYNLSISGDTIHGVLERFEREAPLRIPADKEVIVLFAVGINDTLLEAGQPWCQLAEVQRDLEILLAKAQEISAQIFFLGPTPVDEARTTPVSWGDFTYTNDRIDEFAAMYRRVCADKDIEYLALRDMFWGKRTSLLCDGLHPNDDGHNLIYEQVRQALDAQKRL